MEFSKEEIEKEIVAIDVAIEAHKVAKEENARGERILKFNKQLFVKALND